MELGLDQPGGVMGASSEESPHKCTEYKDLFACVCTCTSVCVCVGGELVDKMFD